MLTASPYQRYGILCSLPNTYTVNPSRTGGDPGPRPGARATRVPGLGARTTLFFCLDLWYGGEQGMQPYVRLCSPALVRSVPARRVRALDSASPAATPAPQMPLCPRTRTHAATPPTQTRTHTHTTRTCARAHTQQHTTHLQARPMHARARACGASDASGACDTRGREPGASCGLQRSRQTGRAFVLCQPLRCSPRTPACAYAEHHVAHLRTGFGALGQAAAASRPRVVHGRLLSWAGAWSATHAAALSVARKWSQCTRARLHPRTHTHSHAYTRVHAHAHAHARTHARVHTSGGTTAWRQHRA